jgi:hypothetical protein
LHELEGGAETHQLLAGQIQRLVDLVCGELSRDGQRQALPRRALLALFLRLFGGQ